MKAIEVTLKIASAAGQDTGDRNMRKNGRTGWNEDDWNIAAKVCNELLNGKESNAAESE